MSLKVRLNFAAKMDHNGVKSEEEDDVEIISDDESDGITIPPLPEGTVVVYPEPVEEKKPVFKGPEFKSATKKKPRGDGVACASSSKVLENLFCTACGRQVNPWKTGMVKRHKELKVLICRKCYNFLGSGEIGKDEDGMDEQCRWCGEGGRLTVCDSCPHAFCKGCIMRNFGRKAYTVVTESKNWECYRCDAAPLEELKKHCRSVMDAINSSNSRSSNSSQQAGSASNSPRPTPSRSRPPSKPQSGLVNDPESLLSKLAASVNLHEDNVVSVAERLRESTSTFHHMLQSAKLALESDTEDQVDEESPFFFSSDTSVAHRKEHCAKALKKELQTFFTSLGQILKQNIDAPSSNSLCNGDVNDGLSKNLRSKSVVEYTPSSSRSSSRLSDRNCESSSRKGAPKRKSTEREKRIAERKAREQRALEKEERRKEKEREKRKELRREKKKQKKVNDDSEEEEEEEEKETKRKKKIKTEKDSDDSDYEKKGKQTKQKKVKTEKASDDSDYEEKGKQTKQKKSSKKTSKDTTDSEDEENEKETKRAKSNKKNKENRDSEDEKDRADRKKKKGSKKTKAESDDLEEDEEVIKKEEKSPKSSVKKKLDRKAKRNEADEEEDMEADSAAEQSSEDKQKDEQAKDGSKPEETDEKIHEDLNQEETAFESSEENGAYGSVIDNQDLSQQEENLFAKLELIQELAEEFCKESEKDSKKDDDQDIERNEEDDIDSDEDLPPISFGVEVDESNNTDAESDSENRQSVLEKSSKEQADMADLAEAEIDTDKHSEESRKDKGMNRKRKLSDAKKDVCSPSKVKKSAEKTPKKKEVTKEDEGAEKSGDGDISSSDMILSSDDNKEERRRKRKSRVKKKEKQSQDNKKEDASASEDSSEETKKTKKSKSKSHKKKPSKPSSKEKGTKTDSDEDDVEEKEKPKKKSKSKQNSDEDDAEEKEKPKKKSKSKQDSDEDDAEEKEKPKKKSKSKQDSDEDDAEVKEKPKKKSKSKQDSDEDDAEEKEKPKKKSKSKQELKRDADRLDREIRNVLKATDETKKKKKKDDEEDEDDDNINEGKKTKKKAKKEQDSEEEDENLEKEVDNLLKSAGRNKKKKAKDGEKGDKDSGDEEDSAEENEGTGDKQSDLEEEEDQLEKETENLLKKGSKTKKKKEKDDEENKEDEEDDSMEGKKRKKKSKKEVDSDDEDEDLEKEVSDLLKKGGKTKKKKKKKTDEESDEDEEDNDGEDVEKKSKKKVKEDLGSDEEDERLEKEVSDLFKKKGKTKKKKDNGENDEDDDDDDDNDDEESGEKKPKKEGEEDEEDVDPEEKTSKKKEAAKKKKKKDKDGNESDDSDDDKEDKDKDDEEAEDSEDSDAEDGIPKKKKEKKIKEEKAKAESKTKRSKKKKGEDNSSGSSDSSEDDNQDADEDEDMDDSDEESPMKTLENLEKKKKEEENADLENELAKAAIMDELEDEDDDDDNDDRNEEDSSSSDSDIGAVRKRRAKKPAEKKESTGKKQEKLPEEEKDSDSDFEPAAARKRFTFKSKLLDARVSGSDSDSDVKRPKKGKKRKRDSDDESFDGDKVKDDDDDDDDGGDSVVDSDDVSSDDDDLSDDSAYGKKGKRKGKKGKGKGKDKGKKRKRIKKMDSSSDEGEEDGEAGEDPGSRKKIRKIKSDKKLEECTKAAAKAEEERRKRVAEKQKKFNGVETKEAEDGQAPITTKLVLEQNEETETPLIQVNPKLICRLKPHQVEAVQFMWDCLFESLERSKKHESSAGCILAHCMGLGKTLSVVAFIHTMMSHKKLTKVKRCLVVSPLNTVLNWENEFDMWLEEKDKLDVYELSSVKQNHVRADTLEEWYREGGIMILGYEMLRNLALGARVRNKKQKLIFHKTLIDPGPDIVVCDEGHLMKNAASALSKSMNQIKTRRRIVLTGTPLQNNLIEYHCMVDFVKPNLLGTKKEFANRFVNPITNGQHSDSTGRDVRIMKQRAHILHELLAGCVQRRDYSALTKFLPPKQEYVISVRLSEMQMNLYKEYLNRSGQVDGQITSKGARLFKDYQNLMKIWTHPWVLKLAEIRDENKAKFDDNDSFIDDEDSHSYSSSSKSSSSGSDSGSDKSDDDSAEEGTSSGRCSRRHKKKSSDKDEVVNDWKTKSRGGEGGEESMDSSSPAVSGEWWAEYVKEEDQNIMEHSGKLMLLVDILRMCEEIGDKVLIFSQSLLSLDIIEYFLEQVDSKFTEDTQDRPDEELKEQFGKRWLKGEDYFRLDGSTSAQMRQHWASIFNDPDNLQARLFLISTRAGGLGINLVGANRVIIFDASWNPSHDVQSIFRVYRFGQTKPCYIYRFMAQGTMEEKIYDRQVTKLSLSQRVVDEHQVERHFTAADLSELYTFRPERLSDESAKKTLMLPKDVLLAEIMSGEQKDWFVSIHEHDSLLENLTEQTLTEDEKKAAWDEYENEKKGLRINVGPVPGTAGLGNYLSQEFLLQTAQSLREKNPEMSQEMLQSHLQRIIMMQIRQKQEEQKRLEMMERQQASQFLQMRQQYAQLQQRYLQQMGQQQQRARHPAPRGGMMQGRGGRFPGIMAARGRGYSPRLMAQFGAPSTSMFHGGAATAALKSTGKGGASQNQDQEPVEVIDLDESTD